MRAGDRHGSIEIDGKRLQSGAPVDRCLTIEVADKVEGALCPGDYILTRWARLAFQTDVTQFIRRRAGEVLGNTAIRLVCWREDLARRRGAFGRVRERSTLSPVTVRLCLKRSPVFEEPSPGLADSTRAHAEQACHGTSLLA